MPTIPVTMSEKTEHALRRRADALGWTLEVYLSHVVWYETEHPRPPVNGRDPLIEASEAGARYYLDRTPEQLEADRAELLRNARRARPLPPGKTLADMVVGKWPGDETDEEIRKALEELS
jgi:hypothetical protein